jgi:4-azaleucine resistance transporter AzlC
VCSTDIPEDVEPDLYYTLISFLNQCYWVTGSAVGGLAGTLITFDITGIDFAMTALFVVIFVEQWLSTRQHIPAVIGVLTTVLCLLIFGSTEFVIPSMISIVIVLTVLRKPLTKEAESNV